MFVFKTAGPFDIYLYLENENTLFQNKGENVLIFQENRYTLKITLSIQICVHFSKQSI